MNSYDEPSINIKIEHFINYWLQNHLLIFLIMSYDEYYQRYFFKCLYKITVDLSSTVYFNFSIEKLKRNLVLHFKWSIILTYANTAVLFFSQFYQTINLIIILCILTNTRIHLLSFPIIFKSNFISTFEKY